MIRVECHHCHKTLKAPDDRAGQSSSCPNCGASIVIPRPDPARVVGVDTVDEFRRWADNDAEDNRTPPPHVENVDYDRRGEDSLDPNEQEWARHRALVAKLDELVAATGKVKSVELSIGNVMALIIVFWIASGALALFVFILFAVVTGIGGGVAHW